MQYNDETEASEGSAEEESDGEQAEYQNYPPQKCQLGGNLCNF